MNILKYCSSSWLTLSVCLSVWEWNIVDNLLLIPNILFNSCIIPAMNWGPLSDIILSGNLCNFYMLSLNNIASSSTNVFFVVEIKYTIFVNLSTTTKIESYPCVSSNLVIKSTEMWAQGFSRIEFSINFPASCSVQFLLC